MLLLHKQLLSLRLPASPVIFSLRRALLSTSAATDAPPPPFAVDDYLVTTCGLTPEQALKAAKRVSHCKSTSNADSVLAYLAGPSLRLSKSDIAHVVARDPRILNCSVENTLKARVAILRGYGLSEDHVRTFLRMTPGVFRSVSIQEKFGFWLPFLGSPEKFIRILKGNYYLLTSDLERVVKPNIAVLRESGHAVTTTTSLGPETMAAKLKLFEEILGWSEAEVAKVVRMNPTVLRISGEKLRRVKEFLTKVVGVDTRYILTRPSILMCSLECQLVPRHYVMKVLQEKGLIQKDQSFYPMVRASENTFQLKYIDAHRHVLPGLADAYAAACQGKLPTEVAV
ncbi:hypothetical protein CFC21_089201 [Triticum aestivum]|uniref:Uncharacterized protein n=3 Tax=Triticum TaxID=4564 RepID=A0A9R0YT21_TRITD|nr:hypothetical protein CFC21_089201 [Triticum aestivum]VAI60720.1 unnamed protein product [Triticum turgidum subsp. durum]